VKKKGVWERNWGVREVVDRGGTGGGGVDGRNFKIELHFSVFFPLSHALYISYSF
jgi:hypothetical protein